MLKIAHQVVVIPNMIQVGTFYPNGVLRNMCPASNHFQRLPYEGILLRAELLQVNGTLATAVRIC